jgi:hypothetical protein
MTPVRRLYLSRKVAPLNMSSVHVTHILEYLSMHVLSELDKKIDLMPFRYEREKNTPATFRTLHFILGH